MRSLAWIFIPKRSSPGTSWYTCIGSSYDLQHDTWSVAEQQRCCGRTLWAALVVGCAILLLLHCEFACWEEAASPKPYPLSIEAGARDAHDGVLVVGATNRVSLLDDALLRKGRFDISIYMGRPSTSNRFKILQVRAALKCFPRTHMPRLFAQSRKRPEWMGPFCLAHPRTQCMVMFEGRLRLARAVPCCHSYSEQQQSVPSQCPSAASLARDPIRVPSESCSDNGRWKALSLEGPADDAGGKHPCCTPPSWP